MIGQIISLIPGEDLLKLAPLIIEVALAAIDHADEKALAVSLDPISRGAQYAKETGDTSQLELAISTFLSRNRPTP